jgi:arsenate reductase-like glutaredoxin family protein
VKAREFLAQTKKPVALRNLIKEPLSADEIRQLARRAGGVAKLVAPKRRAEAEGKSDAELVAWLAEDGARLRRPIIDTGKKLAVGFAADARAELEGEV